MPLVIPILVGLLLPCNNCPPHPDDLEVAEYECGAHDPPDDADDGGGDEGQHVHVDALVGRDVEQDVAVGAELPEGALEAETAERGVQHV